MSPAAPTTLESQLGVPPDAGVFNDIEVQDCDEPVRRYFRSAIAPGTPLARAARLRMRGSVKVGKLWMPFRSDELLAPLHGYYWPATVAGGLLRGSDSYADGAGSMAWKLAGVLPVIRAGGPDFARSATGRAAAEGVWLPTALLPRYGVRWHADDDRHIVAAIPIGGEQLNLRITVDTDGLVRSAHLDRWGDPDGTGQAGWHPFGIEVVRSRTFACGITMPADGSGGWFHTTDRWRNGEFFRYSIHDLDPVVSPEDISAMKDATARPPKLPPPWFKHTFWRAHRAVYGISGGRFLWTTSSKRGWGALHLTTVGRKSGQERSVILGYIEDGPNLVVMAMNGWDEGHPSWWLNLEAHPDAVVRLARQQPRPVRARAAEGAERDRLWQRWLEIEPEIDAYASRRSIETPIVVFEPRQRTA